MSLYEYRCEVRRVVDGDTLVADIDLGLYVNIRKTVRMLGYNAPELFPGHAKTLDERNMGKLAKEHLEGLLAGHHVNITTTLDKDDKYGRVLGSLFLTDTLVDVNAEMLAFTLAQWRALHQLSPLIYPEAP
jgi:endonuclease YncB( thermonuclease family)